MQGEMMQSGDSMRVALLFFHNDTRAIIKI